MFKFMGNKKLFILLFAMIFFIAIMGLTLNKRENPTWPEKMLQDTVSWVQGMLYKPAGAVAGFFEDIRKLQLLYEENEVLKLTLSQYAQDSARLNDLEAQNARLLDALKFTERQKQANKYTFHIAEVVAFSSDPYNRTIKINLGEKDGIRENMAVTTIDGLIGRVTRVMPFYSNVQLITDLNETSADTKAIAATAKGKESKSFGMIDSYNRETGMLHMTKIPQDDALAVGDLIVTSGLGEVFPRGLVVGTVVSRQEGEFGITHTAEIKPAADFREGAVQPFREVFVVEVPE